MPDADPRPRDSRDAGRVIGRYALYDKIASGGMASVHFARLIGPLGFSRVVAVKRLHPQFAKDPEFVAMLLDEARLAARVRHPNVVPTIDVVATGGELFLVMEYVQGESLGKLIIAASERDEPIPPKIAITILIQALWGLHAAHEAKTPRGASLGVIHRDVSPQNILVGDDGVVRIVDFGVAKAAWRAQSTREGQLKGKIAYMPPEQLRSEPNQDRRVDVYAASVCLWEALTSRRYVDNDAPAALVKKLLAHVAEPPSKYARGLPRAIDAIVLRGLAPSPKDRFATAHDMATELERAAVMASAREVGDWVRRFAGEVLDRRARVLFDVEGASGVTDMTSLGGAPSRAAQPPEPATSPSRPNDASVTDATPLATAPDAAPHTAPHEDGDATTPHRVSEARAAALPVAAAPASDLGEDARAPSSASLPPAPPAVSGARPSRGVRWAVAGVVGAGLLLATWALASRGSTGHDGAAPEPTLALSARVPAPPVSTAAPEAVPPPPATPAPAAPSAEERAAPPTPAEVAPEAPRPPRPPAIPASATAPAERQDREIELPAAAPATPHPPRPNCHPPYTLDSEGVRIPKRECLHP